MGGVLRITGYDTDTEQRYLFVAGSTQEKGVQNIFLTYDNLIACKGVSFNGDLEEIKELQRLFFVDGFDLEKVNDVVSRIDKKSGVLNNYFVGDRKNLTFYDIGDKDEIIFGDAWAATGHGASDIAKFLDLLPKKSVVRMPMDDVLNLAYDAIDFAVKKNENYFGGGNFCFGAAGEKNSKLELDLCKLRK